MTLIPAYCKPSPYLRRDTADLLVTGVRTLSEVIGRKGRCLTAKTAEPWTCTACCQNRHSSCVSDRCECGRKHL